MEIKELKKQYKKAIQLNLKNINENIDDILNFAFKNHTKSIEISMKIEPDAVVGWECKCEVASKEYAILKEIR